MSDKVPHRALLQRALQALDSAKRRADAAEAERRAPVAIVGWACRLPGGLTGPDEFWQHLLAGDHAVGPPPGDRPTLTAHAAWLQDLFAFDAAFFGMTEAQAAAIDPQQRLALEVARAALEDAHVPARPRAGINAGVYVAASTYDFALELVARVDHPELGPAFARGGGHGTIPGRVSQAFGLIGPSVCMDATCASGLVALEAGVRALRDRRCDLAVVIGVNAIIGPYTTRAVKAAGLASADGHTRAFTAEANGYGRGEAAVALVLRRGDEAQRLGHRERGRVLSVALGHAGGGAVLGLPSAATQAAVMGAALEEARVDPAAVGFVEAHASGTPIGDLIELETIGQLYGDPEHPVHVASVKGNLGHTEAAAGLVGVLRAALQLQAGMVAPHVHAGGAPTPGVDPAKLGLAITAAPQTPRGQLGAVSAFSVTGTHAHAIIAPGEPPAPTADPGGDGPYVLPLSAGDPARLRHQAAAWARHLQGRAGPDLRASIRAAALGRAHGRERLAIVGPSSEAMVQSLLRWRQDGAAPGAWRGHATGTAPPGPSGPAEAVAAAWVRGCAVDWSTITGPGPMADVPLSPRVPVVLDLERLGPRTTLDDRPTGASDPTPPPDPVTPPRPETTPSPRLGGHGWTQQIVAALSERLGPNPPMDTPLSALGVDSLALVSLRAQLEQLSGHPIPITMLLEHPTLGALARALASVGPPPARPRPAVPRAVPIAVVGLAAKFPGAPDAATFWQNLLHGVDAVGPVPPDRWDADRWFDPTPGARGRVRTRSGAFLADAHGFDARFFGVTPREAEVMDPQHRLLLEVAWTALEHANIPVDQLGGTATGVFVGISSNDYLRNSLPPEAIDGALATGNAHSIAANRLSYALDLRGPSVAVDTACSSSLVAAHLACQSLAAGECDVALVGGVNLLLSVEPSISFSRAGMLSADGRCRTFDAQADGYGRGEGCGVVVLKRLDHALDSADTVLAVIRGSAVNQDGRSQGLTAPSLNAQVQVIQRAMDRAGLGPDALQWVETHGTGTPLGDPIEVEALRRALAPGGVEPGVQVALGAVKTHIGHLEAAAGIAGLIKATLAMHHGVVPPNLHFRNLNPHIDLAGTPFYVPVEQVPWAEGPRAVGVSSFGFGGTNAHVVLSNPPPSSSQGDAAARSYAPVITISARTEAALTRNASAWAPRVHAHPLRELADTSTLGRAALRHRLAWVGPGEADDHKGSAVSLEAALTRFAAGEPTPGLRTGRAPRSGPPRVGFICPGQGTLPDQLTLEMLGRSPVFTDAFNRCRDALATRFDLMAVLQGGNLRETQNAQPALVAVSWCYSELLRSLGVHPDGLIGHSVGEVTAWAISGAISIEDALGFAADRGAIMQRDMPPGAMGVCYTPPPLPSEVVIAARNGLGVVVVAGPASAVRGVADRVLPVDRAFHTVDVDRCMSAIAEAAEGMSARPGQVPVAENATGALRLEPPDPQAWAQHARAPVEFAAGLASLVNAGVQTFVELGPGSLAELTGRVTATPAYPTMSRRRGADRVLAEALAGLWVQGCPVQWEGRARPAELPSYPFEHTHFALPQAPTPPPATGPKTPTASGSPFDFVDVVE